MRKGGKIVFTGKVRSAIHKGEGEPLFFAPEEKRSCPKRKGGNGPRGETLVAGKSVLFKARDGQLEISSARKGGKSAR